MFVKLLTREQLTVFYFLEGKGTHWNDMLSSFILSQKTPIFNRYLMFFTCSVKCKRTTVDSVYNDLEAQSSVMAQAKEVQAKLSPSCPSLIKVMLPSHVTGGFWLVNPLAIHLDWKWGLLGWIMNPLMDLFVCRGRVFQKDSVTAIYQSRIPYSS